MYKPLMLYSNTATQMSTKKKDQGFTNIRIREETREELRAIGSYGENMDDIVRKCLASYKSIISSGGRVVNKIVIEEPKEQTQMQQQYQQPPQQQTHPQFQSIRQSKSGGFEYLLRLPGLKFPATKHEIHECAKKAGYSEDDIPPIAFLEQLPDNRYDNKNKFERDYSYIFKDKLRHLRGSENLVVTFAYNKQITTEQGQTDTKSIEDIWRELDKSDPVLPPSSSNRMLVSFWLFIKKVADERNINTTEAAKLIANNQSLLDDLVNDLGIKNVNDVTNMLKSITDKELKTLKTLATGYAEKYEE